MRKLNRCAILLSLMVSVLAAGGCSTDTSDFETNHDAQTASQREELVKVERRDLVATFSTQAVVQKDAYYVVLTTARSSFTPKVDSGAHVKKGDVLGVSAGKQLLAPADSTVSFIQSDTSDLPANYPVVSLIYSGFSLPLEDKSASGLGDTSALHGSFQIVDGPGPSECQAVVLASAQGNPKEGGSEESVSRGDDSEKSNDLNADGVLCLVDKSVPVREGQQATVVLRGTKRTNVLALPLSAVAGRSGEGKVMLVKDGKRKIQEVGLGISDGAVIEITSGLKVDDEVSAVAPNLDPRES